jgi:soluble lytic murein transglycosylase-like protein
MILARASRYYLLAPLACSLAVMATQAQADVLELGSDGARWIAGGPVGTPAPAAFAPANAQGVATPAQTIVDPRVQTPGVPAVYAAKVAEVSRRYNLSPRLIEALVWQESRWRHDAVSSAGARGLTQLMPGTARYLGVNPDDPMQNLEGGARYLREQLDRFDGNLVHALAAYNAGPGRVIKAGGVPNIRETRNYVAAIMARLANSRQ